MGLNSTHSFIFFIYFYFYYQSLSLRHLIGFFDEACFSDVAVSSLCEPYGHLRLFLMKGSPALPNSECAIHSQGSQMVSQYHLQPQTWSQWWIRHLHHFWVLFTSASPSTASPSAAFVSFTSECGTYTMVGTAVWLCGGYNTCSFFAAPWFNPGCSNLHVCCWWWLLTSPRLPFSKLLIYLFKQESQISWTIESTDFASFLNT